VRGAAGATPTQTILMLVYNADQNGGLIAMALAERNLLCPCPHDSGQAPASGLET